MRCISQIIAMGLFYWLCGCNQPVDSSGDEESSAEDSLIDSEGGSRQSPATQSLLAPKIVELPVDPQEVEIEQSVAEERRAKWLRSEKLLEYNLEKLDAVYEKALEEAQDDEHREALKESQAAWLKFYEADGKVATWNAKGGRMAYNAYVGQKLYQLRMRMYLLSTPYMQGWRPVVPRVVNPEAAVE